MEFTVAKFGGTSVGSVEAILRSATIVKNNPKIKVVVVSATSGTTNELVALCKLALERRDEEVEEILARLLDKHLTFASQLNASSDTVQQIEEIILEGQVVCNSMGKGLDPANKSYKRLIDRLLSVGERTSSLLFATALQNLGLKSTAFDVRTVLKTDSHFGKAEPQTEETRAQCEKDLLPLLTEYDAIVTQGFIGSNKMGQTTTLGRGGSDYSAALLAEALNANALEIWTDVKGIYTTDPRITDKARAIEKISFAEAAELAAFGAKVLHPATLWPAIRKNINVFVGSSKEPEAGGTWIYKEIQDSPIIRAIALRKNQTLLTVSSLNMLNAHGFLAKLFSILAEHKISVDLVTTSEVSVSLTIDGTSSGSDGESVVTEEVLNELREFCRVRVDKELCLIAIIGNNMHQTRGLNAMTFGGLSDYNIRLICQGASTHNTCFLVHEGDANRVVADLHEKFLENESFDSFIRRNNLHLIDNGPEDRPL